MLVLQNDDQKGVVITKGRHRQWQPTEPFRDEVDCQKKMTRGAFYVFHT
jgi:hypothetical protein